MKRRDLILGCGGVVLASALPAPARAATTALGGDAFGSTWRLVVAAGVDADSARGAIEAVIAQVDATMSPYRAETALSQFNRASHDQWHVMPSDVCAVAGAALEIASLTGGAFDPTIGPLVNRFGFGPIEGQTSGWQALKIDGDALLKAEPGATLDLCGIAKGHALDRIVAALLELGVADGLVELGGEVAAFGHHPDGRDWKVAIEDPRTDGLQAQRIVAPAGQALATSGHRVNGLRGAVATSHIIDPALLRPVDNGIASVSVLAQTAMRADALATALSAMAPGAAPRFAADHGIAALFVADDGHDIMTGAFGEHVVV